MELAQRQRLRLAAGHRSTGPGLRRAVRRQICHEVFVPLGCRWWDAVIEGVERSRADAAIMLLVGEDAVHFNRAVAAAGLDVHCRRLSTLIDENTLAGSGADNTHGISAAAAYFETLTTPEASTSAGATPGASARTLPR